MKELSYAILFLNCNKALENNLIMRFMDSWNVIIYLFFYFKQNSVTTEKMHNNNNLNT